MKMAYADPPYLGMAKKLYGSLHPRAAVYDKVENHEKLINKLLNKYPDGWALSMAQKNLFDLIPLLPKGVHFGAWCKAYGPFKKNVNPAYLWEPVAFYGGRKRGDKKRYLYDWVIAQVTSGVFYPGKKPELFCFWVFEMLGMEPEDELVDLFPGSGAVGRAFDTWRRQMRFSYAR